MFRFDYANGPAELQWQELVKTNSADCDLAWQTLTSSATTPTIRTFQLGTGKLATALFRRKLLPQWLYLISNQIQLRYLIDDKPDDGGSPKVLLVGVYHIKLRAGSTV